MATINYNNVFDSIMEAWTYEADYQIACDRYYKKHGFHAYLNYAIGLSPEKRNIANCYRWRERGESMIDTLTAALFAYDYEQTKRLFIATRSLRRWYERTNWQYIPDSELIDRLARFVEG